MECINPTLESFNAFLGEKLSAAAHEIFRFVERTVTEYQLEVERTKQENQRLQRLVDLIYRPDIRLRRSDSGHICLPGSTLEKQIQTERVIKEEPRDLEPLAQEVTEAKDEEDQVIEVEKAEGAQTQVRRRPTKVGLANGRPTPSPRHHRKMQIVTAYETRSHSCHENNRRKSPAFGKELRTRVNPIPGLREDKPAYKTKRKMEAHVRSHVTEKKPFVCYICGRCFDRSMGLRNHMATAHKGEEPFRCLPCKQHFQTYLHFKQHMRKSHDVTYCAGRILAKCLH